jgi:hypothetical protein
VTGLCDSEGRLRIALAPDNGPFVVEAEGDSFVVDGREGWLSVIAGYTKPAGRQADGLWVLEPATSEDTLAFLRAVLRPGIHA